MNKNLVLLYACLFLLFFQSNLLAQSTGQYTLKEIIRIAREQSISSKRAETTKENRYWQYRTFRSVYQPQLSLDGTLPNFNRTVDNVQQNDGSFDFVPVSINNSIVNLRLSQAVAATNTRLFINSSVRRFDNFATDQVLYSGNPMELGILQPLFQFNRLKWDTKIEPLRYQESVKAYTEDLERISVTTSELFFDLLLAQISVEISEKNLLNNDTIYKIAEGRYNLGTIAENELLQLELTVMNSRQQLAQASLDLETSNLRLKTFVGITTPGSIELKLPGEIPDFPVDETVALSEARRNRQEVTAFERRRLEGEREVAQAKGETGLVADLFARFGLANRSTDFPGLYRRPEDQQIVSIGFEIPIIDWGRQKSRVKTAEANQQLINYTLQQDEINFDQEVFTQVKQFKMLKEQILITEKADDIAQRRYDISKNRFQNGKIGITDLNIAMQEKDEAKRAYILSLRNFWNAYYTLRRLTLYDFERSSPITYYVEE
ncbi:MAG: TolC family protein [Cyclobacteriaceae bacterium]|nr:TolC family protein [Cyclobacteriaceae bacterium]